MTQSGPKARAVRPRLGIAPYIVAACMFMENLDATVIVTALPTMADAFGVPVTSMSLGVTAYMVAAVVFLPLNNWLADRIGSRTLMCCAIVAFTVSSLLCGLCDDLASFTTMRVLQGASAALMSPSGRTIVLRNTSKEHLVHAVAILTWPSLIAPVLGPPIGGLLTSFASWRWIFFLNVPLGLIGLVFARLYFPQERSDTRSPLDLVGLGLAGVGLAAVIAGLDLLGDEARIVGAGAITVAAGILFAALAVRHFARAEHPLIDLAPTRVSSFAISALTGGSLTRVAVGATPFLLPLLLQTVLGYSAFAAGATTLVYFAGNLVMKIFTTAALARFGFRTILIGNGLAVVACVGAFAMIGPGLPFAAILAILLIGGATRSLQFTALNTLAFADIPSAQIGAANIVNSLVQQTAMTLGVSLAALALHVGSGATDAAPGGNDFAFAFLLVAMIGLTGVGFYTRLSRDVGEQVSGHSQSRSAPAKG